MHHRILLAASVGVPITYLASQITAMVLNPAFDVATQQPSELGCCDARLTLVGNAGFMTTGLCAVLGGIGLSFGLRKLGGNIVLSALAGLGMVSRRR